LEIPDGYCRKQHGRVELDFGGQAGARGLR
jgi:hypothetical protein